MFADNTQFGGNCRLGGEVYPRLTWAPLDASIEDGHSNGLEYDSKDPPATLVEFRKLIVPESDIGLL